MCLSDLEQTWEESDTRTPLICFLSMGSDPTNNIELVAKKKKIECRAISMGQGQEVHARRLMAQSMTNVSGLSLLFAIGHLICYQNINMCRVANKYMHMCNVRCNTY